MISASDILRGKILIVDDQKTNVLLLERTLLAAGFLSVTSTTKPAEVSELHRVNRYDLILLDIEMPVMDGFVVMSGLKEVEADGYLPVLALTAEPAHKLRALECGAKDFLSKPFDLTEVVMRVKNMLEVRLLHAAARASALLDPLTGLANRRLLSDRMSLALADARRNKSAMAVIYLDLDGFKLVNNTHGHAAGDSLLQMVAKRITAAVREVDTAARLGGDEFAVALWRIEGIGDAERVARKLIETVALPYDLGGVTLSVTTSAGIALYPEHGGDAEALMKRADTALYAAKASGKNAFHVAA